MENTVKMKDVAECMRAGSKMKTNQIPNVSKNVANLSGASFIKMRV